MATSIESRTVLIDMDNTLFGFDASITAQLTERAIALADPALDFYIARRYQDPSVVELIQSLQNSQGFFRNLQPLPGALEAWQHIADEGYRPRICSKPLSDNKWCREEKLETVEHYFGAEAAAEAYMGDDKESEPGIALVDDRPGLADGNYWQRVIYTQPWNAHEQGTRLESWSDPNLFTILANCAARYDRLFGH